jgi:hypothetical protein
VRERRGPDRPTWGRVFLRGLNTSVSGNAEAFGFSVTITVTYGVLNAGAGQPTLPESFGFAFSAVAAFSLLNLVVAGLLLNRAPQGEPRRVVLVATATDFLAVGAGIGAAAGLRVLVGGWGLWAVAPFCAGLAYVLVQALELSVGQGGRQDEEDDQDGDGEKADGGDHGDGRVEGDGGAAAARA